MYYIICDIEYQLVSEFLLTLFLNPSLLSIDGYSLIKELIESSTISQLIQYLNCDENPSLQKETVSILAQMATFGGISDHLIEAGVVPILIRLLSSSNEIVKAEASTLLGILVCCASVESRDVVLTAGVLPALLQAGYSSLNVITVERITSAISNLFYQKPLPDIELVQAAIPFLCDRLLFSPDDETVSAACRALNYFIEGDDNYIQEILGLNWPIIPRLIQLLQHTTVEILKFALIIIGNIGKKDDGTKKVLLESNIFQILFGLLDRTSDRIREDSCWVISNLIQSKEDIQAVINAGIIPKLFQLLKSSYFVSDIWGFALSSISNILQFATPEQVWYLVQEDIIPLFCNLFKGVSENQGNCNDDLNQVYMEKLKVILKILSVEQNTDKLEQVIRSICNCGGMNIISRILSEDKGDLDSQVIFDLIHRFNIISHDRQK